MAQGLDISADTIDVRDVIERFEELETELQDAMDLNEEGHNFEELTDYVNAATKDASAAHAHKLHDEAQEFAAIKALLDELKGNGGDEQWRGDWYPITLIRDSYYTEYTKDLLADCGYIPKDLPDWIAIDWEETAENTKVDYQSIELDDVTYWYR